MKIRLKDIAERAGVSRVAVGKVLLDSGSDRIRVSEKTAALIRKVADELNYQPNFSAQFLAGKRSHTIGAIIDTFAATVSYRRLAFLETAFAKQGYMLIVGQAHNSPEKLIEYMRSFASRGVDGFVCLAHNYPEHREQLADIFSLMPNSVFIEKPAFDEFNSIVPDRHDGMAQIIKYLCDCGRKRIAVAMSNTCHPIPATRLKSSRKFLMDYGLFDKDLLFKTKQEPVDLDEFALRVVETLVVEKNADAIIAANDIEAAKILNVLTSKGVIVPDDVAIVGYDNLDLCEFTSPPLTSVDQNDKLIAQAAADIVLYLINGRNQDSSTVRKIKPKLIIRRST
ncbi:MAG: LacI family DNA-binding transcriptional regulator [Victivallales bacterium]|nr:LacI family DNA-binding transcriptional regulator [Victivallales bacterium]